MKIAFVLVAGLLIPMLGTAETCLCRSALLTEESYTWDFVAEASMRIDQLQTEAKRVQTNTDILRTYARRPEDISQQTYLGQLDDTVARTAAIAENTCRLSIIERMVTPEQRELVGRLRVVVAAMAASVDDIRNLLAADYLRRYEPEYCERLTTFSGQIDQLLETLAATRGA